MASVNTPQLDAVHGQPGTSVKLAMTVADAQTAFLANTMYRLVSDVQCFIKVDGAATTDGTSTLLLPNSPYFFVLGSGNGALHAIVTAAVVSGNLFVTAMTPRAVTP